MRTVQDVMTPNPKMIQSGESLDDVVRLFIERGISSSPVVNPLGEILGVLTELGLVKAFTLHKTKYHKNDKVGHHLELLEPATYVSDKCSISEAFRSVITSPTHRILVRDDKEKIVGIISPKDLLRVMYGEGIESQDVKERLHLAETQLKISGEEIETLEKKLSLYEQAFHETPYMMHAVNSDGIIIMANKREHDFLGYDEGELVGKMITELYAPAMHSEALQGLKKIMKTGTHHLTYTSLVSKQGGSLRCDIASSALYDDNGKFLSTISVLRPVDPEELLRALHGLANDTNGPLARYISIKKESGNTSSS